MQPRITVITLGVDDLDAAVRFYRDGLGFPTELLGRLRRLLPGPRRPPLGGRLEPGVGGRGVGGVRLAIRSA
jgi:catechol 2,3-dioxygenase-like lactoylglutathione lyase family enzyme